MIKKIAFILVTFIFVFGIEFVFLPFRIRWILALLGTYFFITDYKFIVKSAPQQKLWSKLFLLLISLVFVSMLSNIANGNFDKYFYNYPVSVYLSMSSAYAFLYLIKNLFHIQFNTEDYIKLLLHLCVIQTIVSLIGFLIPSFLNFALSLLKSFEMNEDAIERVLFHEGSRIVGIGVAFFGAGAMYAIIISLSAIIIKRERKMKLRIIYIAEIIIILMIGSAIARTTILGVLGFLLVFVLDNDRQAKKTSFSTMLILCFIVVITVLFYTQNIENNDLFGTAFDRAFSLYYTFQDTGHMQSLDSMVGHSLWPNNMKTWVIGDGLMSDPLNPGLATYLHIDRGWNRIIFGIGILGLTIYVLVQYYLCRLTCLKKVHTFVLILLFSLFMIKGTYYMDAVLSVLIMLNVFNAVHARRRKVILQKIR